MAKKRNRITLEMSQTIADSSPLIKSVKKNIIEESNNIKEIDLNLLVSNPYQPRLEINLDTLNDLIASIEENGLLQPILITKLSEDHSRYTIVAGHRRYEAFKILGKSKIPVIIKENLKNKDLAVLSLTENLLRENLHPIENAIAIKNILDNNIVESQNKLAQYVGLSKGYVSKLLNILKLPSEIIQLIKHDNYKDINILILLNKLKNIADMLEAYKVIKSLSRAEAEKYIKKTFLSLSTQSIEMINIKKTKTSIGINIDLKKLSPDKIVIINEKINTLNKEILLLVKEV